VNDSLQPAQLACPAAALPPGRRYAVEPRRGASPQPTGRRWDVTCAHVTRSRGASVTAAASRLYEK
jgi:hypothetical protein